MGPFLFLVYINDLHNAISCNPRLFVDDTCFFFSSNKLSSLETYMNHDLNKFRVWAIANKLTVNPNKSHALIISHKCSDKKARYSLTIVANTQEY